MSKSSIEEMQEAERKAIQIIADAQSKSTDIMENARKKAAEIIEDARVKAEAEQKGMIDEAYKDGERAVEKGSASAKKEADKVRKTTLSNADVGRIAKKLADKIVGA